MPKITVLTITCRSEYRDMQAAALKLQTFQDFEWIVVDDHVAENNTKLREAVDNGFRLLHIPPRQVVPYYAGCMALNTALVHAGGELIYFMPDYMLPQKNCLEQHWRTYQKYPNHFVSGGMFKNPRSRSDGIIDLEDIRDVMDERSIELFGGKYEFKELERGIFSFDRTAIRAWWGKNDSVPFLALITVNGFDENLDGARQDADANMVERLYNYGLRYIHDINSHGVELYHTRVNKEEYPNPELKRKLINNAVSQNTYLATHDVNLEELRRIHNEHRRTEIGIYGGCSFA